MIKILYYWESFFYYQTSQASKKKEFAAAFLDPEYEIFVVHVASLENSRNNQKNNVYLFSGAKIAILIANEVFTSILTEYSYFAKMFSPKLASELLKHIKSNNYAIELIDERPLLYGFIYSLGLVELETQKTYIKTNLVDGFIRLSKSLWEVPILFDKKPDETFWLCIDYQELNNLTIKNQYLLPLVREFLD